MRQTNPRNQRAFCKKKLDKSPMDRFVVKRFRTNLASSIVQHEQTQLQNHVTLTVPDNLPDVEQTIKESPLPTARWYVEA